MIILDLKVGKDLLFAIRVRLELIVFVKDTSFLGQFCFLVRHELTITPSTAEPTNSQIRSDHSMAGHRQRAKGIQTKRLTYCSWM